MCRQNHGIQVDYFAVGVMAFECMFGKVIMLYLTTSEALPREVTAGDQRPHTL